MLISMYTGYNYGTSLQAYAMNKLIEECGCLPKMMWHSNSLVQGRDITIAKLFAIFINSILHPKQSKKVIKGYQNSFNKNFLDGIKEKFNQFAQEEFLVERVSYHKLKKIAHSSDIHAVVCGSDQIWNGEAVYISPYYYLKFAPNNKKIAYAPSFGKNNVIKHNQPKVRKLISSFNFISVREERGKEIVKELTGREAKVVLDPTLAINKEVWQNFICENKESNKYFLCYFLDEPNDIAKKLIEKKLKEENLTAVVFPYEYDFLKGIDNVKYVSAGPKEFVNYIKNAEEVFTDSFHGTAFSIIFNKQFNVFKRQYNGVGDQSSRIVSLLTLLDIENKLITNIDNSTEIINYDDVNEKLEALRVDSRTWLINALEKCDE